MFLDDLKETLRLVCFYFLLKPLLMAIGQWEHSIVGNSEDLLSRKYQQCQLGHWKGPGRETAGLVQGTKKCLLSRHLVTLYFISIFNHRKWVKKIFSGDLLILLLKFWVISFCFKTLGTNYQYTALTSNIKPTLNITA